MSSKNKNKPSTPNYIIYKTTNLINNKFYIGKDKYNNTKYLGSGKILKQAISLYGRENFSKEVLEFCNSEEEYNIREIFWIKELNSFYPNGYNINIGGKGGDNFTNNPNKEDIANRIRNRPKVKCSEGTKIKMSIARKGVPQSPCERIICPHCNYEGDIRNMTRWHFDNCKKLLGINIERCPHCKAIIKKCNHIIHYDLCIKNPNVDLEKHNHIKKNYMKLVKKESKYKPSEETNLKKSQSMKGRKKPESIEFHRQKMIDMWSDIKEKEPYKCIYCEMKTYNLTNIKRWHNENCKKKNKL